jgi:gliding motility-associated lipoprotein GldH
VLLFEPNIDDTIKKFDVFIQVEHLKSYPFQNLYFSFDQLDGNHSNVSRDTLNIDLINKSGYFTGECRNTSCIANFLLYKDLQFKDPGKQKIKIQQLTRLDSLHGIQNIGLILKESQL